MKLMKRSNTYQASNVSFCPETISAYSYRWWKFVAKIDGVVVFNNYRYSNSTSKHQWKVRLLMQNLGIKIDISAPFPKGINCHSLEEVILEAEEGLCNEFLNEESKKIRTSERAKERREKLKLLADARLKTYQSIPNETPTVMSYQGLKVCE